MTGRVLLSGAVLLLSMTAGALAQAPAQQRPATPPAAAPAPTPTPPPVPNQPAQTTATYGDWVLRCVTPDSGPRSCEVLQTLTIKGQQQPVAQIALGSPAKGEPLKLTVVVPPAISLAAQAQVKSDMTKVLDLTWRRCLPAGCFTDATLSAEVQRNMRTRTDTLQIVFKDAGEKEVALPFSLRGLAQALDALAKEDGAR